MREKAIPKQNGPPFHFFRHYETFPLFSSLRDCSNFPFFSEFFLLLQRVPHQFFDILQQNGYSKNLKGSPFYIFLCELPETSKKNSKKSFSSIFSFLRAFVVSRCRKSGFRVLLSLRYGADLSRSRLFFNLKKKWKVILFIFPVWTLFLRYFSDHAGIRTLSDTKDLNLWLFAFF